MNYQESFRQLRQLLISDAPLIQFEDVAIYKQNFTSHSHELLPGKESYFCNRHKQYFDAGLEFVNEVGSIDDMVHIQDSDVQENRNFSYRIFMPKSKKQVERAVFLMHGFNEKNWDKYLPWAQYITEYTQSAVILFPIAFHMNRGRSMWSEKKKMLSTLRFRMLTSVCDFIPAHNVLSGLAYKHTTMYAVCQTM